MVGSLDRWAGKVAVVTGASSGIGAAIAKNLVKSGIHVVGIARRKQQIEELAASKELKCCRSQLYAVQADMTKEEDILAAFSWIKDNLGPIHILVNSAGGMTTGSLIEGDAEAWRRTFDVNVIGLCIATREAVKDMRENQVDGHIVHLNSTVGHKIVNIPDMNVYAASKYAVTALTETLRNELNGIGSKIKITSISPGYVKTEFQAAAQFSPEALDYITKTPGLEAQDLADAVIYTLSTPPHVQVHEITINPVGGL